jgi:hypothetical protein
MEAHYPPRFDQAIAFLFAQRGNAISEDLVQTYCQWGWLADDDGMLRVTDQGRAELRRARQRLGERAGAMA